MESDPAVLSIIAGFLNDQASGTPMARFWTSFLEMTEILMMNLHALRTQNWDEFKTSLRLMLPWLQIYDNSKYGRWMVEYWLEIDNLPEDKAMHFRNGLFSQSISGNPYSCLPLDLWIEMTMNKGSKMKAGWLKILKNEKMLLTDSRNVNKVNQVRASLHSQAKSTKSKQIHSENTSQRMKVDEQAVQDITSCLIEFGSDPFDETKPSLRSLQSGVVASSLLVDDFESAHCDGERLFTTFCDDRMLSTNVSFYSAVHKNSRRNFSNPPPVSGTSDARVNKSEAMENKAMASIIALAEAHEEKFNLVDVMDFRVTDECLPIFNVNGTMRKTQKSKLVEKLHMETFNANKYIAIVDMGFFWRLASPTVEDREKADNSRFTWRDYASKLFSLVMARHRQASTVIMVNDRYDLSFSIKDSERQSRCGSADGIKNVYMHPFDKFPSAKAFQDLLRSSANKSRLQVFLHEEFNRMCQQHPAVQFFYSVGPQCWNMTTSKRESNFECEHIEADTAIFFIYSRIRQSGVCSDVVIDSEDTDVLILSAHVAHSLDGALAIKRKHNIINCKTLCSREVAEVIVQLHVHSGSDTTTAFFGHGKQTVFSKGITDEARPLLSLVGQSLPVTRNVLDAMTEFTVKYIYNDKISKTLGEARAKKWTQMKRKSTLRLPPDQDSHDLKVTRGNYQSYMLLNYHKVEPCPPPLGHGWELINGMCVPVRYTKPALPLHLSVIALSKEQDDSADEASESSCSSDEEDDDIAM